jgi:hypothetical protein
MSILTDNKIPAAPTVTPEMRQQRLKAVANIIVNTTRETFNDLVRVQRRGIDLVWADDSFTPQEILNELGDQAPAIFAMHRELSEFITDVAAANNVQVELKQPTHNFTLSGNNIIVGDKL